jgi:hypothetical protein
MVGNPEAIHMKRGAAYGENWPLHLKAPQAAFREIAPEKSRLANLIALTS